ncbi:peptidylprolyl isomerase [SAR92 clade bacterium H455]|uniref:Chaperone SurA n=1 Tax=SAR92 clade bacterium H455 TaxID=2974818 RepID=A0ABY5TM66_9GAMM|nr:peptidylprolyl isomerase [SAR92 clade bacterium H455]
MDLKKTCNTALLAVLLAAFSVTASAQVEILDKVVAIVDEDVVLESEVQRRLATIYAQIQKSGTQPPPQEIVVQQVLERLISERLQLNMGYSAGIRITDAELNDAMARIASSNQLTMEQYAEQVHASGSTLANVREEIRNEMILMRVQQGQVMRRIRISSQELDNFLNSEEGRFMTSPDVNVGHILLPVPSGKNNDEVNAILQRAQGLLDEANNGTDFRQLAIANSADQTALQGGDLGWRKMAQLPGVFIEAVEGLEIGQISAPIRSDAGYHLIKLYGRKGGGEQLIEQHFARHILIKPNEIRDEATAISQLTELRERIKTGEDFALLAKEFSEDPGSALNGGELGWSTPGMFVPEFEQTMSSIELDEVSAPFLSQFGWHILQVTERRKQDFSENITRNRAQNLLRQRKYEEELQVWLQEIRDEAFVEIKESAET